MRESGRGAERRLSAEQAGGTTGAGGGRKVAEEHSAVSRSAFVRRTRRAFNARVFL